ncbi:hypothetical protein [Burkholderia sp. Ax-1719]|uniref:hypothetical protein n=1 Tax=Burkholderia sp. Ax-1719 TaxID=2608334 RepID=UPI00141F16CF|nr:hypothetical protein [Burkholderia sp. Ax-1719]NIE66798.1 hypothetical protein [Burkholderia sp. Ax-1719]
MLTNALRSLAASALLAVFSIALIACSPTYDWRTISNNTNGYSVDLPAKPGSDARSVDVDGTPMQMHMQTAEVGGAVFVIGTLDLPDAQAATQQKALGFLRDGLARNVGVPPDARTVAVPLVAGGSVPGFDMQLSGKAGAKDETRTIHARLVAKGAHAYQLAIVGREQPAVEQVDQFFQSFKLY